MRSVFVTLLIVISLGSARASDTISMRRSAWGISFSPDYCYRSLNYRSAAQWIADDRNGKEIPKWGFTCGIHFKRRITGKWSAEAGLLFSDKGEKTKWEELAWSAQSASFPKQSRTIFHYQFLSIPLKLYYNVTQNKFQVFVFGGLSPDFFIRQRTVLELKDARGNISRNAATEPGVYSRVNFSGLLGFGL